MFSHADKEIAMFFNRFGSIMAWNFVFFGLSVVCLIGSAVSSLLASYTTPVVVSLCVASLVSITGVLGTLARIYLDFTLSHLKENMVTKKASHSTVTYLQVES